MSEQEWPRCPHHQWATSISAIDIESQIRTIDEHIPLPRLRRIAVDMAQDANRWLSRHLDRRVCRSCGMQGMLSGEVVIAVPSNLDSPTAPTEKQ